MLVSRGLTLSRQHWFLAALAAVVAVVSVQYTFKAKENRSAIVRWQSAMRQLDAGEDIYQRHIHPNSPMLVMLLKPLTLLPPVVGALLWFYLKVGLVGLAAFWAFRLVEDPARPFPAWAMGLTVLLALRPILGDLTHGNVNLFILFLVVAALHAFTHEQDLLAGVLLGLAIACKVTPALFLPYFAWKRAWTVLAGTLAGLALFLWPGFVPGLFVGSERYAEMLSSWVEAMIKPYVVSGVVFYSEHNNQSLPGLLFRLLTESASFSTYINDVYTPLEYHHLARLDPGVVRWTIKGLMGLFALLVIWCCRTPTLPRGGPSLAAEYGLVLLGMLLFSERTWKHHCVTLLLPFAVLCYRFSDPELPRRAKGWLAAVLAAAALLMLSTASGVTAGMNRFADLAEVYGAYVGAFVVLGGALVGVLRSGSPSAPRSTSALVSRSRGRTDSCLPSRSGRRAG